MENLTIGKLARKIGVGASTLRYYERVGLIAPDHRTESGYRLYQPDTVQRLRFIRRAQALGFSLEDIAELLALSDNPQAQAAQVKQITEEKIADIGKRIRDLQRMQQGLQSLSAHCSGQGSVTECPILEALNHDDD
ncbi:MAG: heavy metal-responsive transcriptional regulator [Gammaproteobacteria bacterium]